MYLSYFTIQLSMKNQLKFLFKIFLWSLRRMDKYTKYLERQTIGPKPASNPYFYAKSKTAGSFANILSNCHSH